MAKIKNMGTATMRFNEGAIINGPASHADGSDSDYSLIVTGSQLIDAEGGNHGLTIFKEEPDRSFIRFINSDDPTSWYAYIAFDSAENFYIAPGRSQDFFLIMRTGVSEDPNTFPFRIFDNGKVKFDHGETNSNNSAADLPSDVVFFVSGSNDRQNSAVFGGDVVVSGSFIAKQRWTKIDKFSKPTDGDHNKFYIKAEGTGNQTNPGSTTWWIPPAGGRLVSAHLRSHAAMNSTQITLVTSDAGDNPANSNDSAGNHNFIETQTVDCNAAKTNFTFNFTSSATFTADQAILLKVSGSAPGGDGMLTTVWEYDFVS